MLGLGRGCRQRGQAGTAQGVQGWTSLLPQAQQADRALLRSLATHHLSLWTQEAPWEVAPTHSSCATRVGGGGVYIFIMRVFY